MKQFFDLKPQTIDFDAESPIKIVEAKDLVLHNTGPLTELENLDKG